MMYKIVNGLALAYLNDMFEADTRVTNYNLRNSNKLKILRYAEQEPITTERALPSQ